ncbi:MAG TPA: zinc ribbon domain-containing protein [Telluria sp.]
MRLSEKWFHWAQWLIALAFAAFLIGLGGKVVENFAMIEEPISEEDFIDPVQGPPLAQKIKEKDEKLDKLNGQYQELNLVYNTAHNDYAEAKDKFDNWINTRQATARPEQDGELIARTRELDSLKATERNAAKALENVEKELLGVKQASTELGLQWQVLMVAAQQEADVAARAAELRIFLYRLALTLPLLVLAVWLFVKKRKGAYWPFAWGFIFFALFVFFVELVPYLPSYGGYVRYAVGLALTAVAGRYGIIAMQRYLARQREAEALPDEERRATLSYDLAMTRLNNAVCPGCERPIDLKNAAVDYCAHCGINVFDRCGKCSTRKGAFARFCFSCGTAAQAAQ